MNRKPNSKRQSLLDCAKFFSSNPFLNRLIVVDTKALRRGLMSGETLRAPRQQLRWFTPRPSFLLKPLTFSSNLKATFIFSDFLPRVGKSRVLFLAAPKLTSQIGEVGRPIA